MTLSDVEAMVARLSRRKEPTEGKTVQRQGPSLSKEEAEELFERLAKHRKNPSPQAPRKNIKAELSNEDIDGLFERLSKQRKPPSPPPINRGEVRTQMEVDSLVERLAVVKQPTETSNGKSKANRLKLSKSAMQELVTRLSNKEIALERTPDAKRVMDKKYGIVSSYAWNGCNHQAVLCNEESP